MAIIKLALARDDQEVEKAQLQVSFATHDPKCEGWKDLATDTDKADTLLTRAMHYDYYKYKLIP